MRASIPWVLILCAGCGRGDSISPRAAPPSLIAELAAGGVSKEENDVVEAQGRLLVAIATKNTDQVAQHTTSTFRMIVMDADLPFSAEPTGWLRHPAIEYWQALRGEFVPPTIEAAETQVLVSNPNNMRLLSATSDKRAQATVEWQRTSEGWRAISALYQYARNDSMGSPRR